MDFELTVDSRTHTSINVNRFLSYLDCVMGGASDRSRIRGPLKHLSSNRKMKLMYNGLRCKELLLVYFLKFTFVMLEECNRVAHELD